MRIKFGANYLFSPKFVSLVLISFAFIGCARSLPSFIEGEWMGPGSASTKIDIISGDPSTRDYRYFFGIPEIGNEEKYTWTVISFIEGRCLSSSYIMPTNMPRSCWYDPKGHRLVIDYINNDYDDEEIELYDSGLKIKSLSDSRMELEQELAYLIRQEDGEFRVHYSVKYTLSKTNKTNHLVEGVLDLYPSETSQ